MIDKALSMILKEINFIDKELITDATAAFNYVKGAIDLALTIGVISSELADLLLEAADIKKRGFDIQ